jgi:NAD-dependent SIR2 family protein deacetylase
MKKEDKDTITLPEFSCPKCGYKMDRTTGAFEDAQPMEGDISMCLACGSPAIFRKDLTIRIPTEEEALDLAVNPEVIQFQITRAHVVGDKILKTPRLTNPGGRGLN